MKRYFWILAAALVSLAACDKNELQNGAEETPGSPAVTYIRALGGEDASKALIDNTTAAFTWSEGDTIAVYTTSGYKISDPLSSGDGAGTNNATFVFSGANAVTEAERADFAFYPASLVHGKDDGIKSNCATHHTAADLVVRLRKEYSLSEVSGDKAPTPMIATNAPDGDLSFKALCPLIRITVKNVPATTKRLVFEFEDRRVNGEFSLSSVVPGTTYLSAAGSSFAAESQITILTPGITDWQDVVVNLPVPVNTNKYPNVIVRAYDAAAGGNLILQWDFALGDTAWDPTRKASRKFTAVFPVFSFSGKKGVFAPANLQAVWDGSAWTWQFAANEYEVIKSAAANTSITGNGAVSAAGTVDLFGWSTDNANNYFGINKSEDKSDYSGDFVDWGVNTISGYAANYWNTPSSGDWTSVFETRTETNMFVQASVHDVRGVILFPDGLSSLPVALTNINDKVIDSSYNKLTDDQWLALKSLGCVFLPKGGSRTGTSVNTNFLKYWSGTKNAGFTSYFVFFPLSGSASWTTSESNNIIYGYSVRLVHYL